MQRLDHQTFISEEICSWITCHMSKRGIQKLLTHSGKTTFHGKHLKYTNSTFMWPMQNFKPQTVFWFHHKAYTCFLLTAKGTQNYSTRPFSNGSVNLPLLMYSCRMSACSFVFLFVMALQD